MTRMTRLAPLAALVAVGALLMTTPGCGGTAATLAAEDAGLVVFRRAETEDPKSLDPHKTGDVISSRHAGMAYETLYQYDFLERPAKLVPSLAVDYPGFDRATNTYTFKLRDDVFFADDRCFHPDAVGKTYAEEGEGAQSLRGKGRKLTAADMVYSFKRLAALPDAEGYWIFEGKVKGIDEFRSRVAELRDKGADPADPNAEWRAAIEGPVSGLRLIDDRTFQVSLSEPYPQFLYAITMSYGAAVAREACDYYDTELVRKPVGTGPFILKSWRFSSQITWERNPNYRDERFPTSDKPEHARFKPLMGKRLPLCDRVVFRIIKESQTEFLEFLQGNLDIAGLDKDQFSAAITPQSDITPGLSEKGIKLQKFEEPTVSYISFNMNDPDIGTPGGARALALRRAIAMCIDRDDLIRRLLNGRGTPAQQVFPPAVFGYAPENDMQSQRHDPAAARKILQQAGFRVDEVGRNLYRAVDPANGKQATVNILLRRNDSQAPDYMMFIKTCGDRIGVRLQCEQMTFSEFLRRQNEGTGQAYDAGWVMDYPDAQNNLQLLYGPNRPPGINSASYASPEYDRLYKQMAVLDETVPEQREEKGRLIALMHKEVDKDVPWVLTYFRKTFLLYQGEWFQPPDPNVFAYTYIKYFWTDTPRRGELATSWATTPVLPGLLLSLLFLIPMGMMGTRVIKQAR